MAANKERSDLFNLTFSQNKRRFDDLEREREDEEIELSLGLSLNGRFGVDPNRPDNASLVRSSSVSNFALGGGDEAAAAAGLGRTLSMPGVTEEELRRRRDEQMVRRLEAKRKRVEKMMSEKMKGGGNGRIRERHVAVGGSQASGGSSGGSESEAPPIYQAGINIPVEIRSSGSVQSQQQNEPNLTLSIEKTNITNPSIKPTNEATTTMNNMMVDMPSVSTRGVGPSGRRIEGFLYRYTKGEEVKIVCVCHGSFLSPAEFVKHAGGEDVSHPLKHIVINSSPVM